MRHVQCRNGQGKTQSLSDSTRVASGWGGDKRRENRGRLRLDRRSANRRCHRVINPIDQLLATSARTRNVVSITRYVMVLKPSTNQTPSSKISSMRLLQVAIIVALVAAFVAQQIQLPFVNSTGWMINSVPYDKRVYWMKQAKEALHNASGPWYECFQD